MTGYLNQNHLYDFYIHFPGQKDSTLLAKDDLIKKPSKPSCTVMIKYMEEKNDIFIGHNTWYRYEAMSYRLLKNYRLNYHVIPSSSVVIPGHTVAMSSYAGIMIP